MCFLNRIFRRNQVECPRCLGKGNVDIDDIRRLRKELFWGPGKCAYCNGIGKVSPDRIERIKADFEYLTTDLTSSERRKIINNDQDALERANMFKAEVQRLIEEIRALYFTENKEPEEIAEHLSNKYGRLAFPPFERNQIIEYIEKVINAKS